MGWRAQLKDRAASFRAVCAATRVCHTVEIALWVRHQGSSRKRTVTSALKAVEDTLACTSSTGRSPKGRSEQEGRNPDEKIRSILPGEFSNRPERGIHKCLLGREADYASVLPGCQRGLSTRVAAGCGGLRLVRGGRDELDRVSTSNARQKLQLIRSAMLRLDRVVTHVSPESCH